MSLSKIPVNINFAKGLSTKDDPKQLQIGSFLELQNSIFDTTNQLTKRNGFGTLTELPNTLQTTLTTLNDNLLATGSNLYAFSQDANSWLDQGTIQPIELEVESMVRSSTGQISADAAVASSGLTCLVYIDTSVAYYQISDSDTGQQVVARTALPATAKSPRAFVLGRYFVITFMATVLGSPHLQYIAIPISTPSAPLAAADLSTNVASINAGYDGYVANNALYFGWEGSANTVKLNAMSSTLTVASEITIVGANADLVSVTADITGSNPVIWLSYWDTTSNDGYSTAYSHNLVEILAPTQIINNVELVTITSSAQDEVLTVFYEVDNDYDSTGAYPNTVRTDYVSTLTIEIDGTIVGPSVLLRSVGLASKSFIDTSGVIYMMVAYGEANQPTYFLIDSDGNIYMRLAYSNGGGYAATQVLANVSLIDSTYYVPYLIKDFLASVNKGTSLPANTPTNGIFTQTGVNLAKFEINANSQQSSEIANALHLTGGQMWEYDGVKPVELGFHVWPENVASETTTGSGGLVAQNYYYVFCYEWTDNQGNIHRSAPSIPLLQTTTTGSSTNTLYVPTLRLTYKTSPNPVRIVGYRWSTAQPVYYQFTSITSPTANDATVDYVTITDDLADSAILGNPLLYTTGGVVENIAPPPCIDSALYKNRMFLIDAENQNLIWFSKTLVQNVPVEFSDLFTIYVAPTIGAQGSTGPAKAISAMDDKFIIFKKDAMYYLTGNGPDNTGANNDYGDPIFITSSVGCDNPNSIVLIPLGLMFQSDKGIWLLGRDLSTKYIGAAVERYNDARVLSAIAVPGTNQVRFTLDNDITLVYDYYFDQWGTFTGIPSISSTLYQGKHTYLNEHGEVRQETPDTYLDGTHPVLMSFTTSWINFGGVGSSGVPIISPQGYERFYFMYLLGTYYSPFRLNVQMAYNYNSSATQSTTITPDNYAPNYGEEAVWGSGGPWGGSEGDVFTALVYPEVQKCNAFQITVTEIYDPSYDQPPGQGLSLSGLNCVIGVKRGYRTSRASRSFG